MSYTLFEISWEVCNKVGGIHTVLSSKARTAVDHLGDHYITVGPWLMGDTERAAMLLERLRSVDPLSHFARIEEALSQGRPLDAPFDAMRSEFPAQDVLEAVVDYGAGVRDPRREPSSVRGVNATAGPCSPHGTPG